MKVLNILSAASLYCLLLIGCTKSSTNPTTDSTKPANDTAAIISGNWVVSSYTQRTENKTAQFANAIFTFSNDGKVSASQNGAVTTGAWVFSPSSVGYYGAPPTKASMTLNMGTSKPMKDLNRTWNVVSVDAGTLSLINPEPADDERIVFSKK